MTDEKFIFVSDVRDKKRTATGAHHKRTHCGKGGSVKFPSDHLSKKELKAMSGESRTYRMNDPMGWEEFWSMPDDLKKVYVQALRSKFNVSDSKIFEMMGITQRKGAYHFGKIGLSCGRNNYSRNFDKDGWYEWLAGVAKPKKEAESSLEAPVIIDPIENICEPVLVPEIKTLPVLDEKPKAISHATPRSGSMTFEGRAVDVLNTVSVLLGGGRCPYHNYMGFVPRRSGVF